MKLTFRLAVFASFLALASCTTTRLVSVDDSKSGNVVVSLREKIVEDDASLGFPSVTTVTFQRVGESGNATIANRLPQTTGYARPDFGDEKTERGQVFMLRLPAGTWRFDSWKLSYDGAWTTEFFHDFAPLTFEVRPGETSYIGSIEMSYSVTPSQRNLPQVEEITTKLADRSTVDLPVLKGKHPNVAVQSVQLDVIRTSGDLAVVHSAR